MTDATESRVAILGLSERSAHDHHHRLVERLIDRLPDRISSAAHWLRRPSSRWLRIPAGVLLILGGFLAVLPLFGLWMLPLGLLLLAEDIPVLRRTRNRVLDMAHRRWPHWFARDPSARPRDGAPPAPDNPRP
jgi:hypothetical protein